MIIDGIPVIDNIIVLNGQSLTDCFKQSPVRLCCAAGRICSDMGQGFRGDSSSNLLDTECWIAKRLCRILWILISQLRYIVCFLLLLVSLVFHSYSFVVSATSASYPPRCLGSLAGLICCWVFRCHLVLSHSGIATEDDPFIDDIRWFTKMNESSMNCYRWY